MTDRSPGTREPGARGRVEHAEGLHVGRREDRRGPPAQRQQLARELQGALAAVRAAPDVARGQRDPGLTHHRAHALQAPLAGGERERVVLDVAHEGDVAVAGLEQMPAAIAPPATSSMATLGTSACATSTRTIGTPSRCSARTSAGAAAAR
jgi:hypothetical protein